VRFTDCPAEKIRVIENPLQKCLVSGNKGPFREKCPTILQVGTMPNKNILNLAYALRGVNCRLRIVGKLDEGQTDILRECSISYKNDVNISDEEMKNAYEDADIVAFCSTYEGFGLPIIEAQASRTPVVTSDISPLREVAGGAACLVDPTDPLAIRDGIRKVISCATYRQELVERGVVNVKRFDSRLIAAAYERLYDEILANIA
jgi:glycosyltransferase involved in cell wall biosynthesis